MDESAIIAKLQGIHLGIDGVRAAPTSMPAALTTEMLPCTIVYPGAASHTTPYRGGRRENREYLVRLYVSPVVQGEGVEAGYQACLPFFDRFADKYHTDSVMVPSDQQWTLLSLVRDSGIRADLTLHGTPGTQPYWGVTFMVQIKVKEGVS